MIPLSPSAPRYARSRDPMLKRILETGQNYSRFTELNPLLDPYNVYTERARELARASTGIEKFAYSVFGPQLMASVAFAIDPLAKFHFTGAKISPVNRTRKFTCIWPLSRGYDLRVQTITCSTPPDTSTSFPNDYLPESCAVTSRVDSHTNLPGQVGYNGFISDTTIRTRGPGTYFGEMELFAPHFICKPRTHIQRVFTQTCNDQGGNLYNSASTNRTRESRGTGPSHALPTAGLATLLSSERSSATTYFSKYGYSIFEGALPLHKQFDLAYNLAELKDLPQMLRSTVQLFKDFPSILTPRGAGNQYLNLKFGWESTLNAVRDLLLTPTYVAKRINFLLKRRGKATTYRSSRKFLDVVPSIPAVTFNSYDFEANISSGSISRCEIELRVACNATFDFPDVKVPTIRNELWYELMGVKPTPSDVYELVPWSWLVDWFSGAGAYINLIDTMSRDPSLVNYGFITYVSKGNVSYNNVTRLTDTWGRTILGHGSSSYDTIHDQNSVADLNYRYQKRSDITSIGGTKAVTKSSTLSATQLAIVGALLSKFT